MAVKIIKVSDRISGDLQRISRELDQLPEDAYDKWVELTPKRSGNAKRKTKLSGDTIHANYPYADRLDQGYSKQAKDGMSKPVEKFITSKIKKIMR